MQIERENFDESHRLSVSEQKCIEKLYTACKTSNVEMLEKILDFDFHELVKETKFRANDVDSSNDDAKIVQQLKEKLLSHPLDKSGDTLLHVVSRLGEKRLILKLLENGSDPAVR